MRLCLRLGVVVSLCACAARGDVAAHPRVDPRGAGRTPSAEHYGPPRRAAPAPLAAGQWTAQHVVDEHGTESLMTTKVLRVEGERVWLESETRTDAGATAIKVQATIRDRADARAIEVHEYWLKHPDGRVERLEPDAVQAIEPTLRRMLTSLTVRHTADGRETVTVPAGRFEQAYRARVRVQTLGVTLESDVWWHPDVPLSGGLKSVGVDRRGSTELVAFGTSGAKSVFP